LIPIQINNKLMGLHGWDSIFMITYHDFQKNQGGYRILKHTVLMQKTIKLFRHNQSQANEYLLSHKM
jgi:hypothetical protein